MLAVRRLFAYEIATIAGAAFAVCAFAPRNACAQAAPEAPAAAPAAAVAAPAPPAASPPAAAGAGPKFRQDPVIEPAEWKKKVAIFARDGKADAPDLEPVFDKHYEAALAEFTQEAPAHKEHLADKRNALKRQLNRFYEAPDHQLHDRLATMLESKLRKMIANPEYSPAARINYLLIYADLNSNEGNSLGVGAVPDANTWKVLIAILKNKDARFPSYLLPPALYGVSRHITDGTTTPEQRREAIGVLTAWLLKPPSQDVTPEAQAYLRRRATDTLRTLLPKAPEINAPEVVDALFQFAADEKAPIDDRCEAVRTLGMLDSKAFPERNAASYVRTLAALAAEIGRQSAPDTTLGAAPLGALAPPAVAAPVAAVEKPHEGKLSPEYQNLFLQYIRLCITGAETGRRLGLSAAATGDEAKQQVADLSTKVAGMIKIVQKKKAGQKLNATELDDMQAHAAELEKLFKINAAGPATGNGKAEQALAPRNVAGVNGRPQPGSAPPANEGN